MILLLCIYLQSLYVHLEKLLNLFRLPVLCFEPYIFLVGSICNGDVYSSQKQTLVIGVSASAYQTLFSIIASYCVQCLGSKPTLIYVRFGCHSLNVSLNMHKVRNPNVSVPRGSNLLIQKAYDFYYYYFCKISYPIHFLLLDLKKTCNVVNTYLLHVSSNPYPSFLLWLNHHGQIVEVSFGWSYSHFYWKIIFPQIKCDIRRKN